MGASALAAPRELTAAVVRNADPARPFGVETLRLGTLGPRDVLVRIAGVGMCHTDLAVSHIAAGGPHPVVLGHEGAGVVEAVGEAVTALGVGDHVVMSYDSCGVCALCRSGRPYYCVEWQQRNGVAVDVPHRAGLRDGRDEPVGSSFFGQSSFATYAVASENNTIKVDAQLPLDILGPLGCGLLTGAGAVVNALRVRPGESLVVFGAGAVGLAAVMAARVAGASSIVAVDLVPSRRELAAELGATYTLDGRDPDLLRQVGDITGGGADYSFDTTGVPAVVTSAVAALAPGGTCGLVAIGAELALDPAVLVFGRSIVGTFLGHSVPQNFIPVMIDWWRRGQFPFDRLIHKFGLEEINGAAAASEDGSVVKPVLVP